MNAIDFEAATKLILLIAMSGGVIVGLRLLSAWARRIGRGAPRHDASTAALSADTADLRDAVQRLSGDVAELQERVDFAERLLARQRDAERLKG